MPQVGSTADSSTTDSIEARILRAQNLLDASEPQQALSMLNPVFAVQPKNEQALKIRKAAREQLRQVGLHQSAAPPDLRAQHTRPE